MKIFSLCRPFVAFTALLLIAKVTHATPPTRDESTLSNYEQIVVTHLHLRAKVDPEKRTFRGQATLTIKRIAPKTTDLLIDAKELTIHSVTGISARGIEQPLKYSAIHPTAKSDDFMGQGLDIKLAPNTVKLKISYTANRDSASFQWVTPEMTRGGKLPFFYTHSESVNGRAWIPMQDTPSVRMTYSADVQVDPKFIALMSSKNNPQQKIASGRYHFYMDIPIPSYLIALAVGDISFQATGPHTGVYAEPSLVGAAAKEFSVLEQFLKAGQELYGPYLWGRYDVLMVPSFTYGGMENPLLTFANTVIVTGDRSDVWVLAHELAHSWSGNTITNATWEDFWLNEGWTTYAEQRIVEKVLGKAYSDTIVKVREGIDRKDIQDVLDSHDHIRDAALKEPMDGRNPSIVASQIPYYRGEFFLKKLEQTVGRESFDRFTLAYMKKFKYQSIVTEQFLDFLDHYPFVTPISHELIDEWVYNPQMPTHWPITESADVTKADQMVSALNENPNLVLSPEMNDLSPIHFMAKIRILDGLSSDFAQSPERITALRNSLGIGKTNNPEVISKWCTLAVTWNYTQDFDLVRDFITRVSRKIMIKPIYKAIDHSSNEDFKKEIIALYAHQIRKTYSPITQGVIDPIMHYLP